MSALRVERAGSTVVWTIERAAARNAVDPDVVNGLARALTDAESDKSLRAAILTGAGDAAFVAGADLKFLRSAPVEERAALDVRMFELLARIEALPVPVIAALNGVAVGGGVEIALACDLRVAEPHASFTFKHAAMGVTPGWGGLGRLASLVGRGAASKALFTAQPLSAEDALRMGLVDEIVPSGTARARALELGRQIAETSPAAVADLKRLLTLVYRDGRGESADEERRTFLARARDLDHAEALTAFFAKRAPVFQQRD